LANGCATEPYQTPEVPLVLPADHAAVINSLTNHGPGGFTPTRPALEGTLDYATSWAAAHPTRRVVVVLATAGTPPTCSTNTLPDVSNIAAAALAASGIQAYVIGVGSSLTSLNQIAQAGGTSQAFLIDTATDVGAAFHDAMNQILTLATPCGFPLPAS